MPVFHSPLRRHALAAAIVSCMLPIVPAAATTGDPVASAFADPPSNARPRVWWHWMNGNITKDGIQKDLDWMSRSGLGGLQNFDVELMTPKVVAKRLSYMSPEWKEAFKFAVELAEQKNLEFGIAASPGWSETGGPWVRPQDGMKKLVWSETLVEGGQPIQLKLPPIPRTTGPFQDLFMQPVMGFRPSPKDVPSFGADVAVYAVPVTVPALPPPVIRSGSQVLDAAKLAGAGDTAVATITPAGTDEAAVIALDYATPQTVRSATVFFPGADPSGYRPVLESSTDGQHWRKVADLTLGATPTSAGFAPVTAAHFRVVVHKKPVPSNPSFQPIPGADPGPFAAMGQATPLRLSQLTLSGEPKVNQFETKAGFATANDYYGLDTGIDASEAGIAPASVVDLANHVDADGNLSWTPPNGTWRILRIGYSLTGTKNHPATREATGLEVDKYDSKAVRSYMETYLSNYENAVGKDLIGKRGIRAMVTDSTEIGPSNWTPALLDQFKRLRGYDARPWLPALTGVVIGTRARTDAFLYDFRRTLADLMASEHYGTVASFARERGIRLYGEALENSRVTLGDDMAMRRYAHVPMAAMWTYRESGPNPVAIADMRGAASVSHLYGQNLVAAESMTSAVAPWAFAPADLQPMIDLEFANGVNLPVVHTSVHQPLGDDKKPGLSLMIFGQYFNRNETWAGMAKPWVDYMARSAYLLQQGRYYADVAYFYGEEAPLVTLYKEGQPADAPRRYAYDFVNADALMNQLSVRKGDLVASSGARYRVLFLGGSSQRMTLATLRRLETLAMHGATIVGTAPVSAPGLADNPAAFASLVKRLWSGAPVTRVGKGRVVDGHDVEAALALLGQGPDFDHAPTNGAQLMFVHRRLDNGDVYFVTNRANTPVNTEARFNVRGKAAQFWHADTGRIEPASYRISKDATTVPMALGPNESVFVVFRQPATAQSVTVTRPAWAHVATLDSTWHIKFDGLAAPAPIADGTLGSLTASTDPLIKYFSGTTTYQTRFTLPNQSKPGMPLRLDLGRVGEVAEVFVNGKAAGIAWKHPYQVEIGALVTDGANTVEVRVANLWVNRLIGDAQPGARKVTFTAAPTYKADAPLRPSGLIGPVTLQTLINARSERDGSHDRGTASPSIPLNNGK